MTRARTRRAAIAIALAVLHAGALAACGFGREEEAPPPVPDLTPVVERVEPLTGPYGTEVRVYGRNLHGYAVYSTTASGERIDLVDARDGGPRPPGQTTLRDGTEVPVRVPVKFPMEGEMKLVAPRGELPLGTFTTTWVPSRPVDSADLRVLGAVTVDDATYVLAIRAKHLGFLVFSGRSSAAEPAWRPTDVNVLDEMGLWDSYSRAAVGLYQGKPMAIVRADGPSPHVLDVELEGTVTRVRTYSEVANVVGVAMDASGPILVRMWRESSEAPFTVVRTRGLPGSTIDAPPLTMQTTYKPVATVREVSGTGTLVYAYAGNISGGLDEQAYFRWTALAADANAFTPEVDFGVLDDEVQRFEATLNGGVVKLEMCATDTDWFSSPERICSTVYTIDGRKRARAEAPMAAGVVGGEIAFTSCKGGVLDLAFVATDATYVGAREPIMGCNRIDVLSVSGTKEDPAVVLREESKVYVLRRRR